VRRRLTLAVPLFGLTILLAACGSSVPTATSAPAPTAAASAEPASTVAAPASSATACTAPATMTTPQTEGPYYRSGAPASADLVSDGMTGTRITLTGQVLGTDCRPLDNAKVEIWQADANGVYDNVGYTLRGYVMTDAEGRYTIRTVVPGEYPGRTEHIHVKVTPAGGVTLTTQLYFPGSTANDGDGIYSPDMLLDIVQDGDALVGTYSFIVAA
jgi:protocatechuate 3,4-dioxygenase beta subunit